MRELNVFCQFRGEGNVDSQRNRGESGKKRGSLQSRNGGSLESEAKNLEIGVNY